MGSRMRTRASGILGAFVLIVVVGLAVVNVARGDWGLAVSGAALAAGIAAVLGTPRLPGRR